ncbi:MAG TPA: HAMP domain-containing protein [Acidimicrobiales bacterium]|nr:HAMP domain-containing protein [Acidimicrobiales bacterium]
MTVRRPLRLRSSILVKSVAAVVLALLLSTIVTALTFSRLTRSALAERSEQLGRGQMSIMQEAYGARDRHLVSNLRNLTQILVTQNMFSEGNRASLIAELGRAAANLELDMLSVVDGKGRLLSPPVAVGGVTLADAEGLPRIVNDGLRSRLVRAAEGSFVQAMAVSAMSNNQEYLVVGGFSFDDEFAFALRKQIGSHDDVLLVASGRVVGSTLPLPPARPPSPTDSDDLPTSPVKVDRADFQGLVSYVTLGRTADPERAAIGLVLTDPDSLLEGSLARARLVATLVLVLVTLVLGVLLYRHLIRPLMRLAGTARRIAGGDLDASFEASGQDEIAMLASSLEQMRVELHTKLELIARQADDLQRQASDLQESSQRIVTAEDNERHRLARDLHDGIQQELVVLRMRIGMAADAGERAPAETVREFEQLGADLDAAIERLREVTRNLYPSILLDRGLAVATRSYIRRLPLNVRLTYASEPFPRLHPAIESGAYFLVCEALTNAFKHAQSSEIGIALRVEGDLLTVDVQDDGRGFRPEEVRGSGGLLHMHDRVRSFGGDLEIVSAPGEGTVIRARFPTCLPDGADACLPEGNEAALSQPAARERTGLPRPAG